MSTFDTTYQNLTHKDLAAQQAEDDRRSDESLAARVQDLERWKRERADVMEKLSFDHIAFVDELEKRVRKLENKTQGMPVIYSNPSPVAEMKARIAELEADKARLDWLDANYQELKRVSVDYGLCKEGQLRAVIDNARREEKSE